MYTILDRSHLGSVALWLRLGGRNGAGWLRAGVVSPGCSCLGNCGCGGACRCPGRGPGSPAALPCSGGLDRCRRAASRRSPGSVPCALVRYGNSRLRSSGCAVRWGWSGPRCGWHAVFFAPVDSDVQVPNKVSACASITFLFNISTTFEFFERN